MTKPQHTPGPWFARPRTECEYYIGTAGTGWNLADSIICENLHEGDAHLIAAAPELLEALENIASGAACLPGYSISDAVQEVHAAIAKAKGQGE